MKKLLSILLTAAMLACLLPVFAVSAEEIADGPVPIAQKTDGTVLSGKTAESPEPWNKRWIVDENKMQPAPGRNGCIFIFDDEMPIGRLEVEMSRADADKGCEGIVFALTKNVDNMNFWENGAQYYFLFIDENLNFRLAKCGDGIGWYEAPGCNVPSGLASIADGVTIAAEWDNEGHVKCYLNGELKVDYTDDGAKPIPSGSLYGVRAQKDSTTYTSIVAGYPVPKNPEVPVAKMDGQVMTGAPVGTKTWVNDENGLKNDANSSIFVFDQEFKAGTIEATLTKGGDNGIVFGLTGDSMDFWEDKVQYYFLFLNNGGELILAKTGEGLGWCWMKSMPCPGYGDNATVDIKVVWSGNGHIEMWGNGKLVYDYCDAKPLTGTRVGVRAGGKNINFSKIEITTAEPSNEGIKGGIELPFAKVGDKTLTGYYSGGPWMNDGSKVTVSDDKLVHDTWATTFVIDNDELPLTNGSLTATVTPGNTNAVDNFLTGILFGMDADKNVTVWKDSRYTSEYYVLFVSQGRIDDDHVEQGATTKLVLAKGGTIVHEDKLTVLAEAKIADGYLYKGRESATITATFKMVDGKLEINGSIEGHDATVSYTDETPLTGSRYGFLARCGGSSLSSLVPVNNASEAPVDPPKTEDPVDPPKTEEPTDTPTTDKPTTDKPTTDKPTNDTPATDTIGADDTEDSPVVPIVIAVVAVLAVAVVVVIVVLKKKK